MKRATELAKLRNIGPTIERRLGAVGIRTRRDLQRLGAVNAFRQIRKRFSDKSISVCYYLYSLEGALRDVHWDDLPPQVKQRLRAQTR